MVTTILMDLDDTILDFKECEKQALFVSLISFGVTPSDEMRESYSKINDKMWKLLEKGEITRDELRVRRFAEFFTIFSIDADPSAFADSYMQNLSQTAVFSDGAEAVLKELSEKYDLYAVTNGYVSTQRGRIRAAGLDRFFKSVFISEEIGFNKPDERFFINAFKDVPDFKREESVILGDSLTSDILGGKNFGIKTVWFNRTGTENRKGIFPDYEIFSLKEFEELVYKI